MISLTTRQRDLLHYLLTAETAVVTADVGRQVGLTPRQVSYSLKPIKLWLVEHDADLNMIPGVGVQIACSPADRQSLLSELATQENIRLQLTPDQRQQLLLLNLLTETEPLILYQLQQESGVSRTTLLKDLDLIEAWIRPFDLTLERRPNFGFMLAGSEHQLREAITAVLWGDTGFSEPLMQVSHAAGLVYELADDADLMPLASHVKQIAQQWETRRAMTLVGFAEMALNGRFTDNAALYLALVIAVQKQRILNGQIAQTAHPAFDKQDHQAVWQVATEILSQQGLDRPVSEMPCEVAYLTMHLLSGSRSGTWPTDLEMGDSLENLLSSLMRGISQAYRVPAMQSDTALREGLAAHLIPAFMRQWFELWAPPISYTKNLPERYSFESKIATTLAKEINAEMGVQLPEDEVNNLVLLLRAAFIRERPNRLNRVIVVCPSGMATAQLLVARLKARFPRLGQLDVLSMRELNAQEMQSAQLIITTVPLPKEYTGQSPVIQVHPLLSAEDISVITQWLA
ncbi:MAG: PRD domain-containing protein [Anaerolineales bacterium]|nr:PRD domain-containing protein [Anaerolineales bacterium]MCB8937932.1 PRD domain-containing protein [Ardenticatenaceae bacterium]